RAKRSPPRGRRSRPNPGGSAPSRRSRRSPVRRFWRLRSTPTPSTSIPPGRPRMWTRTGRWSSGGVTSSRSRAVPFAVPRWRRRRRSCATFPDQRLRRAQLGEQRREILLIGAPALHRTAEQRLANLVRARRAHHALRALEAETGIVPRQAAKRDQATRLAIEVADHILVPNLQQRALWQEGTPMRHQPLDRKSVV